MGHTHSRRGTSWQVKNVQQKNYEISQKGIRIKWATSLLEGSAYGGGLCLACALSSLVTQKRVNFFLYVYPNIMLRLKTDKEILDIVNHGLNPLKL